MDRLHGELIINYLNSKQSGHHWPCPGETISLIHRTQVHIIYQWGVKQIPSYHHCIFHHVVLCRYILIQKPSFLPKLSMSRKVIPMDVISLTVTSDLPLGVMRPGIVFSSTRKQNNLDQVSLGVHIQIPTHLHLPKMFRRQTFQFSWF